MARRYRCTNCGKDFVSEKPACAHCDIDVSIDPRVAGVVQPIATIHYDPPHPKVKHRGLGHRACDPSKHINTGRGTGVASVVNCEGCKKTETFRAAVDRGELDVKWQIDGDEELPSPESSAIPREEAAKQVKSQGIQIDKSSDCGCGKG